ncbi:VOC family protein [Parasedimentitalea marina]|uniref:VOC family protein n=1 Tax=Parasedimentitalea marina TaxID=2483033 RepID=A0A3T0N4J2_9RHOB|nr:VOC family protein [Parasedimentitalea marina]AZV78902.1 VOC family protein [Parasedimentitalea marina]
MLNYVDLARKIRWTAIDHVVVTCEDIEQSVAFYGGGLGMGIVRLEDGRVEVLFGACKLNLQPEGEQYGPPKNAGRRWSANICFLVNQSISDVEQQLKVRGLRIEDGPVERRGALGAITSLYLYDPDDNLIEISEYRIDAEKV